MSALVLGQPVSWRKVRLTEVAELNPRRFSDSITDDTMVSFIPMKAVEEESGRLDPSTTKPWSAVKKGYTPFQDGDVIFAKITPCMENGKYAVARGLHGGKAAGSTEFHVFRPSSVLDPQFLLYFLFGPDVRRAARLNMRGAAGQLRVPPVFFEDLQFPFPPLDEQRKIVAEIEKQFTRLEAGVAGLRRMQANLKRYRAAVLKAACEGKLVPTEACLRQAERGRQAELSDSEGRAPPAPRPGVFFVYAIRCDNDSIYIGQTQDLQKRWKEHLAGQAADWTNQHKPVLIVHYEEYASGQEAVAREKWLKTGFGRKWIRREIAAGRLPSEKVGARQAGYETGAQLLERILTERRQKWTGKGKYQEPEKLDTTKLPELPDGWTWATVDQLAVVVRGASPRPAGDPKYFGGNIPWITVGPITADLKPYLYSVPETVTEEGRERSRYIEPQTLLLTNSGATLGVPKITLIGGCMNDGVAALLDVDYPLKLYLLYFLRSQTMKLRGVNQGAAQPNLNTAIIKAINVPLPPASEQQRIVAEVERRLSVVEELEAVVNANLQRATRLRQSILQRAFTGQLGSTSNRVMPDVAT